MSANADLDINKIGTNLLEPIEKEPDKAVVNTVEASELPPSPSVTPSHRLNNLNDSLPKEEPPADQAEPLTTQEKVFASTAARELQYPPSSVGSPSQQSETTNQRPVDEDQASDDSLIFKIADSVSSAVVSGVPDSASSESHLVVKSNTAESNSDESDFSISLDSLSPVLSVRDTSPELSVDGSGVKRVCDDDDDDDDDDDSIINLKKSRIDSLSSEAKSTCPVADTLSDAAEKDVQESPKPAETHLNFLKSETSSEKSPGVTGNSLSEIKNSSSHTEEIPAGTKAPSHEKRSFLNSNFELSNSNNSFSDTSLGEVNVKSPLLAIDRTEDCVDLDISLGNLESSKMKGEVVAAPMPIPETRSPMIHIPASIVSEFMNSESSLSPVVGKPTTKCSSPVNNYLDELTKLNDSGGETIVVNGSSKSGVAENSRDAAVGVNTDLSDGGLSSTPLIGSTPPDSRPAKPASPAALSNNYNSIQAPAPELDASDKMDVSGELDSLDRAASLPLVNGNYESPALAPSSDPLGDISSFGSTVPDDPMTRPLLTPLSGTVATPVLLADDDLPQSTDITELAPVRTYAPSSYSSASTSTNLINSSISTKVSDERNIDALELHDSEKNNLKRSLPAEDDQNNKKLRLSSATENTSASADVQTIEDDASKALIDAEVQKLRHTASKLRKLKRKDLENMIIELFMNKVLHNHELGKYKALCEKLESTLESNRKKAAQFHKELDDLRKVTRKLQEEHQNRKDHLVTPIKIKRSVGIQAAPHIIQKGIAAACGEYNRTQGRSPHAYVNGAASQQSMVVIGNPSIGTSTAAQSGAPHTAVLRPSFSVGRLGGAPNGSPGGDRRAAPQPLASQMNSANKSSAIIDLTDEEESRTSTAVTPTATPQIPKPPQNLVKVTAPSGFVSLPTCVGAAQYVLVPNSASGGGNTVVVAAANVATNTLAGSSNASTRLLLPSNSSVVNSKPTAPSLLAPSVPAIVQQSSPHPAPLPRTAPQQVVGGAKQLPPQPTLKLSHKDNSIVLSWTMAKTSEHEAIASYQLFAYQESNQPPSPSLWKKVGSVKALELPMACTLTQFMPGHRYHFAVRAVDAKSRLGPFSDPRSIRLEK